MVAGLTAIVLAAFCAGTWTRGGSMAAAGESLQFPVPKPGPEQELLKKEAGVWDASVETMMPDGNKDVSKGVETNTLLGGLWLISDYKGALGPQDFSGHGVMGYDPKKQKYVGTWVDTMSTTLAVVEETYDTATKTMTGAMEATDESGKTVKMKMVTEWKDDNTRIFTMSGPGPDGKEAMMMRITYKRRGK
jgi:uncharacterized protein affecting Mg2+/Co2+ transport